MNQENTRRVPSIEYTKSDGQDVQVVRNNLPHRFRDVLSNLLTNRFPELAELTFDYGAQPMASFLGTESKTFHNSVVMHADLDEITRNVRFGDDNRGGFNGHLHQWARIPNREGRTIGVTIRCQTIRQGVAQVFSDIFASGKSILLLGTRGQGKTTLMRSAIHMVSSKLRRNVMLIDTYNELGGYGDVVHPSLGTARRYQICKRTEQTNAILETVVNRE